MRLRTMGYLLVEGVKGMTRSGFMSFASILTVSITLLVLATYLLLAVNLQNIVLHLQDQVEIVAYLDESFDSAWEETLIERVEGISGVKEVSFVSREQALDRLKDQLGDRALLLEAVEDRNPLRHSIEVSVQNAEVVDRVAADLAVVPRVDDVNYPGEVINNMVSLITALEVAGVALMVLLAVAALLIISNTIRLTVFSRRDEIQIMKTVGATNGFIRFPFIVEGILLGVLGALLAAGVAWYGYDWILEQATAALPFIPLLENEPLLENLSKVLLVIGAGIGIFGSILSVRRHLRV